MDKSYAEKIESVLGCKEKADELHEKYRTFLAQQKISTRGCQGTLRAIRIFLCRHQQLTVDLYGKKTPAGNSTCLALSVAAILLAQREGADAKVRLNCSLNSPMHYMVHLPTGQNYEIANMKAKPMGKLFERDLTPESVLRHMKVVDNTLKKIRFRDRSVFRLCRTQSTRKILLSR